MNTVGFFFQNHLGAIFLVYGLAFVVMGLVIFAQPIAESRFKLAKIIRQLGWFGVLHGINEWLDGWAQLYGRNMPLDILRLGMIAASYLFLFEFGRRLFRLEMEKYPAGLKEIAGCFTKVISPALAVFIVGASFFAPDPWRTRMTWTRYLLGFPGGLLISAGFFFYYKYTKKILEPLGAKKYFNADALAFLLYGILAGLIVPRGLQGPWQWLKLESFFSDIGIPLQVFRTACAIIAGWATIGMLRIFQLATIRDLEKEIARSKRLEMEREWLNNELVRLNEKLVALDKRKSDVVAMVSHEFRGPLGILQEAIDLLLQGHGGDLGPDQRGLLEMVKRSIARLIRLVTGVLDISKIEAGKIELKKERIDLPALIDEVVALHGKKMADKQIVFQKKLADDTGVLWADQDKLSQVLINLLANAIQYTPSHGSVTVAVGGTESEVRFEISDTGSGIPKEYSEKIFDRFERIGIERQEGTGLGLPIAKDIVELHKGRIWVESEVGKGSKFCFVLPRNFRLRTDFSEFSTHKGEALKGALCDSLRW